MIRRIFSQKHDRLSMTCKAVLFLLVVIFGRAAIDGEESQVLADEPEHLIVVVGAAGSDEYATVFSQWAEPWRKLAVDRGWKLTYIDDNSGSRATELTDAAPAAAARHRETSQRETLRQAIESHLSSPARLWLVMLGHGTFSGKTAKFNLVGPDVSADEVATWLKPLKAPMAIINCSSASAPFLTALAGPNRVLVTATRAGGEMNFSRFGQYFSQTINDLSADVDHDLEVSLLEAFLAAAARTERFYREDSRLTTEHALLDDNGDRVGTSSDFYRGARPVKSAQGGAVDGEVAKRIILYSSPDAPVFTPELESRRTAIEQQIDLLRRQRIELTESSYFDQLEQLLLQLSKVYAEAEAS
jgi:hypothetical protein